MRSNRYRDIPKYIRIFRIMGEDYKPQFQLPRIRGNWKRNGEK